jgi:glucose/arabinose dehydrogenase
LAFLGAGSAQALTLQQVGGSFDQPTYVTSDPGDAGRLFVVEREGTIELVEGGVTSEFADLGPEVDCAGSCQGERGLMSIALAPDFDSSGRLYVDYANNVDGTIHIDELTAAAGGKRAPLSSLRPLLSIPHPTESNHNGGQLQFGPDGNLYISTGDGGGGDDQLHNAQNLEKPLGKILRIRPKPSGPAPFYTVPTGNPFAAIAADYAPIWSYGLRNPFRFSFDSLSGDMAIGDVGQGAREEIDLARSPLAGIVGGAGVNYGWNCREGFVAGPASDPECATPPAGGFTDPVFDYPHTAPPGGTAPCAIIGGYVVRDHSLGQLYGRYLYGDLCVGELRSIDLANPGAGDRSEGIELTDLNSFGEDSCHRIYAIEGGGHVYRLTGPTPADCSTAAQPTPRPVLPAVPQSAATAKPTAPTFIGIKAQRRRVERGKRALLTVWVSPCTGRKGQAVELVRNGHTNGTRFVSRACTAHFNPKIRGGTTFAALTHEGRGYLPGRSRQLTIRLSHRHRQ